MKRLLIILMLSVACWYLAGNSPIEADIYTWTDENGVRHYSNSPPPDAKDSEVIFEEYQHDPASDKERFEMEQQEWKKLMQQIEADEREAAEEAGRRSAGAQTNQKPSMEERTAAEKKRLEDTIADLEEKPLDFFGSQKNKRVRLGYYRYRLDALMKDPENYFNNPESFQGNVKETEQ